MIHPYRMKSARAGEPLEAWKKIKALVSEPRQSPYDRYSAEGIQAEFESMLDSASRHLKTQSL